MTAVPARRAIAGSAAVGTAALLLALSASGTGSSASAQGAPIQGGFEPLELALETTAIDDIGAVDIEGDGDLDLFTSNHRFRQSLLVNDGAASFEDRLSDMGLDHTPDFPGWEAFGRPEIERPGLYLFENKGYEIVTEPADPEETTSGRLVIQGPVEVRHTETAHVEVEATGERPRSTVSFETSGAARIKLVALDHTMPIRVAIDGPLPLERIYVGSYAVNPTSRWFKLYRNDRHGIAWADVSGDRRLDAFIVRGGINGLIGKYRRVVQDELLIYKDGRFTDMARPAGIRKASCRGRGVAAGDFDADSDLDLFVACAGSRPQLYRADAERGVSEGRFARARLGAKAPRTRTFAWVELGGDRRPELVSAGRRRIAVYRLRRGGKLRRLYTVARTKRLRSPSLAVADFDSDGDADLFAADKAQNAMLENRGGRLRFRPPRRFGLPSKGGEVANWVDFNNDGLTDLHLLPHGLFRQSPGGSFRDRGILTTPRGAPARAIWPDLDNDGCRDPVLAWELSRSPNYTWSTAPFRCRGTSNHWLEIDLVGRRANPQAVGARVAVRARPRGPTQTQWVGQNDGTHLSQGDYRLYFGVGKRRSIKRLEVTWPNGRRTTMRRVPVDQVLTLSQGG